MSKSGAAAYPRIRSSGAGDEIAAAVRDLSDGIGAMLGRPIESLGDPSKPDASIQIELGTGAAAEASAPSTLDGDSFELARAGGATGSIELSAGSRRGLIHAVAETLNRLGARFAPGAPPLYPRIDDAQLARLEPFRVTPAFSRRAFVSDILTWNYNFADRLELHLRHDRDFVPWMARRGINAFSYIRHPHDTRLKIDEIAPLLREHGIDAEYGGHVLQILLPRDRFEQSPELFPAGEDGARLARGNLCVSNPDAMALVCTGALAYVREHRENRLLHIWGADVRGGAWCRCGHCAELAPQIQYMEVVNAIAAALGEDSSAPPVAYLAYHDTLEPHRGLRPLDNVWFEWAPRERCYSHAIDDPACETNPRYLESLKRYIEIFDGRGHVFEYYADAILFGGLGFATPAVVASDLRAYRALGLTSVSCLTFGAFSTMAYPANLEAFVRGSRDPAFDSAATVADSAAGRHPKCAQEMSAAYRAVEQASNLVLDYADVMLPRMGREKAARKRVDLKGASRVFDDAIAAAEQITSAADAPLAKAEVELWRYSSDVLGGLSDYLAARELSGTERRSRGAAAIAKIRNSIERVRDIDLEIKGTWGAYDLEWMRELWLRGLERGLDGTRAPAEEIF
ncbi:MAG TPA: DUF4838 domain-containing protein [Candidatus Acidoferrales bacterium]|nr:DUF4838 domain-containing protein [Candidatus Acidoferrales bacterium]